MCVFLNLDTSSLLGFVQLTPGEPVCTSDMVQQKFHQYCRIFFNFMHSSFNSFPLIDNIW